MITSVTEMYLVSSVGAYCQNGVLTQDNKPSMSLHVYFGTDIDIDPMQSQFSSPAQFFNCIDEWKDRGNLPESVYNQAMTMAIGLYASLQE